MKILYTCDNNYIWMMRISMISLLEVHKNVENIIIYLIGENITEENKCNIKNIAKNYNRECIILDLPNIELPNEIITRRWPKSAFTRLFAAEILPSNIDKVLYLDCDTIVKEPLSELFLDNSDKIFLGVKDCVSKGYKRNIGLLDDSVYINAGVLLINLKELRKINVYDEISIFLKKYKKLINYADQDILNGVFKNQIDILEARFNVMTIEFVYSYEDIIKLRKPTNYYLKEELEEASSKPAIIHYTTNMTIIRPWFKNSNHPRKEDFLGILNKQKDIELKEYEMNSKKEKFLSLILKLPRKIGFNILGIIHSVLLPLYLKMRGLK